MAWYRRVIRTTLAFTLVVSAAVLAADPQPGLSVRVMPGSGYATEPLADRGALERLTRLDVDYTFFQFPVVSLSLGPSYSRAQLASPVTNVVAKLVGHAELAALLATMGRVDLSIFARAGAYRLFTDETALDGRVNGAVSGGVRLTLGLPELPAVRMALDIGYTRNYDFRNYFSMTSGFTVRVLKPRPMDVDDLRLESVFPTLGAHYIDHPFGSVVIRNRDSIPIEEVEVTFYVESIMNSPWTCATIDELAPGEERRIDLVALIADDALSITSDTEVPGTVVVAYRTRGDQRSVEIAGALVVHSRNALTWEDDYRVGAWVTTQDAEVLRFARNVASWSVDPLITGLGRSLQTLVAVHHAVGDLGIAYVVDPSSPYADRSRTGDIDFVQFPRETLINRAGDCDDLSVLYAALLEAAGVDAAFITVPGHILIAAAIESDAARAIDQGRLIEADGRSWLPLETTLVGSGFVDAWDAGVAQWSANESSRGFFTVNATRESYRPPSSALDERSVGLPAQSSFETGYAEARAHLARSIVRETAPALIARARRDGRASDLNRVGVLHARYGLRADARTWFLEAVAAGDSAAAWTNLGNLALLESDYETALACYQRAAEIGGESPELDLQLARVHYELGNYEEAATRLARVSGEAPELVATDPDLSGDDANRAAGSAPVVVWWQE